MTWGFHVLRDSGRQGRPALQATQYPRTRYNAEEPAGRAEAQTIIEGGFSFIPGAVKPMAQLTKEQESGSTDKKKHGTEATSLNYLAFQRVLFQQKTADTLAYISGAVFSSPTSLKRSREEVSKVSKERDEFRVK